MNRYLSRRQSIHLAGLVLATGAAGCIKKPQSSDDDASDPGSDDKPGDARGSVTDGDHTGFRENNTTDREPEVGLFDDFEALSNWSVIDGTITADTDRFLTGAQSARIDVADDDVRGAMHLRFDPPIDLTNRRPQLGIQANERIYPRIRVTDQDSDWLRFRIYVQDDFPFQYYDFGIETIDGTPDVSNIVEVRLDHYVGSDASRTGDAYQWLDHGFDRGAAYFAYPFSSFDVASLETVSEYHDIAFASGYPAVGRSMNPYLVHRSSGDPTVEEAISAIDFTAAYGGYSVIFYHKLTDERYDALVEIVSHLDSLRADGNIEVKSVSQIDTDFLDPQHETQLACSGDVDG